MAEQILDTIIGLVVLALAAVILLLAGSER